MRDFKRIVKGVVLEQQVADVDLNPSTDSGAMINFENRIRVFLNGIVKEALTITRASTSSLQTYISQGKIANGEMVFNTELNTFQQVINEQLVSLGSGGGGSVIDPELENRVDQLESDVDDLSTEVQGLEQAVEDLTIQTEDMQDNLAIVRSEAYDLIELTGLPENSKDLGAFSGVYLQDGMTIKEALQALETAVEVGVGSVDLSSLNAQIDQVQDDLLAEEAARINGESTTLNAANSYTDSAIASIPSTDLSALVSDISDLQIDVTSLQSQINTINDTTIPTAISTAVSSANSYTDSQLLTLETENISRADLFSLLGISYYEGFEGTIQGSLSNGAVISNYSTDPLNVLEGNHSLYLSHSASNQTFVSNPINIPLLYRSNGEILIRWDAITTIAGDHTSPKAIIRLYDISNAQYLTGNYGYDPSTSNFAIVGTQVKFRAFFIIPSSTEQVRIEIISNTTTAGDTIIDNLVLAIQANNLW